jgi:DNA end-binding protein Ku
VPQRERRARRQKSAVHDPKAGEHGTRPIWSGSLSFGLVSVPVDLYAAQRSDAAPLRMLAPDGTPLARQYVCPKEDKSLAPDELVRGYEVSEGRFIVVSDEDLARLAPRRSRDIALQRFVDRSEIDPVLFIRAYYLVPAGEQTKAYRLLAEIMEDADRAGIASFVMREREYAIAIFADSGILRGVTLRFADELRSAEAIGLPKAPRLDPARVRAAKKAISSLAERTLSEAELRDATADRLMTLARKKHARGQDVVEFPSEGSSSKAVGGAEVIDLMALLKQRLGSRSSAPKSAKPVRSRQRRRARSRRA